MEEIEPWNSEEKKAAGSTTSYLWAPASYITPLGFNS